MIILETESSLFVGPLSALVHVVFVVLTDEPNVLIAINENMTLLHVFCKKVINYYNLLSFNSISENMYFITHNIQQLHL